ncbi:MAG: hypothetical protein HY931_04250 [Candidatus Falkowbacteria bacterium]|nr:MAG: hypothetical protein HY931_04250 [Candidatus Falkowbacteria bacterium]
MAIKTKPNIKDINAQRLFELKVRKLRIKDKIKMGVVKYEKIVAKPQPCPPQSVKR